MAQILSFTGGLQNFTSSFLRRPDQLIRSINVHGDNVGSLTERLGYSQYGTHSDSTQIYGMHSYNDVSGGTNYLFRLVAGVLQYHNGSAWTNIQSGLNTTARAEFRVFLDQLFMVGEVGGTFLSSANIDGITYSESTNLTSAPNAKFVEVYKDRVYMANLDGFPDRFQFSSLPSTDATTITWTSTNFERVYTNNGEEIMGMHTNKMLNELLLFKETSMHAWDTFRLRDAGNVGTTAHRSIKTLNFTTFFFNADGVYAYSGSRPQLISRPIQPWIDGIDQTKLGDVFAEEEGGKFYKLNVGSVTVEGKVYSNVELRYSISDNTWTVYSYADNFAVYAKHKVSGEVRVYGGTDDGDTHQFAHLDDAVYDDDGTAIASEFMFETDLGLPSERKKVGKALLYCTKPQNLTGRIRVRGEDWSANFSVDNDEQEINTVPNDGRFLQWHFSSSSAVTPFQFEGLTFVPTLTSSKYA